MIFLFLLFPFFSYAQADAPCSSVKSLWDEQSLGKPDSQENTEWCFAYAAANVLSIKLGKKIVPQRVALDFHLSEQQSTVLAEKIGGQVSTAMQLALVKGVCLAEAGMENSECSMSESRTPEKALLDAFVVCDRAQIRGGIVKAIQLKGNNSSSSDVLKSVNLLLERNEPVALSLDLGFMSKHKRVLHAVTIVGRQFNAETNQCEYLAIDSSKSYPGMKEEYRQRKSGQYLVLSAKEIQEHSLSLDFMRGKLYIAR